MLNHAVAELGGVEHLSDFASYFIVATDFLTASANMCSTSLHLSEYSLTYGGSEQSSPRSSTLVENCDTATPRSRLPATVGYHNLLQPVIETALSFDQAIITKLRAYLREHSARFYQTATSTIQPNSQEAILAARVNSNLQERLANASESQSLARYLAISLWLRLLILQVLNDMRQPSNHSNLLSNSSLVQDSVRMLQLVHNVQIQVQDTGWKIPCWLVVWTLSLVSCLPQTFEDDRPRQYKLSLIRDIIQMCKGGHSEIAWDKRSISALVEEAVPLTVFRSFDWNVAFQFCGAVP